VREIHRYDQNFPGTALARIVQFLDDPDVLDRPEKHQELIDEMKMEAILSTENSPYAEVRANVVATDDPDMPSLTIRVWIIGCIFSAAGAFIDSFFLMRNPPVYIGANVAQLLACELFVQRYLFLVLHADSLSPLWSIPAQSHATEDLQTLRSRA
jgi:hypothetical protein